MRVRTCVWMCLCVRDCAFCVSACVGVINVMGARARETGVLNFGAHAVACAVVISSEWMITDGNVAGARGGRVVVARTHQCAHVTPCAQASRGYLLGS
jgi:hypothetical protein